MISVLFFAYLKDKVPGGKTMVDLPAGSTVDDLIHTLEQMYPELENKLHTTITAINHEFAANDTVIPDQAEVAFFPPVSGGTSSEPIILLTKDPLSADQLMKQMIGETTGAICCFTGVVRNKTTRGGESITNKLFYEAYEAMACEKMHQIAFEIHNRWPEIEQIAIVQRIGSIQAGEPSVLVVCSSSHRDTGIFIAAQYGIDRLKEIVPVWKKDISEKEEHWVSGEYHPRPGE